ncbi:NAD-dependent epimerase/dehydratase family protein [Massilia glaciei]|uniref:NAD-dependent epimerase/dehydratase family protein n=1 Tax=Massilia glaciei TaxID=1524097 RepID=UPI0015E7FA85|nr:SDR family oxidoreductase [Massilia glaciei]
MNKILITGATGQIGGALAACFLARNVAVVAVSRDDPAGERTETAIGAAAHGFGLAPAALQGALPEVVNVDFSDLEHCLPAALLDGVTHAWHCCAEMSSSPGKLGAAFDVNVGANVGLFTLLGRRGGALRRFYHLSSAYVACARGGAVAERLPGAGRLGEPHLITKWAAEHALHLQHLGSAVPLTIVRPTLVVGHRDSGWTGRGGAGLYMFADALRALRACGHASLNVALDPAVRPDLVTIDQLAAEALALTLGGEAGARAPFEVFHCSGGMGPTTAELLGCMARAYGVTLAYGAPLGAAELQFARATAPAAPYANTQWRFARGALDRALGRAPPDPLTLVQWRRLVAAYLHQHAEQYPDRNPDAEAAP